MNKLEEILFGYAEELHDIHDLASDSQDIPDYTDAVDVAHERFRQLVQEIIGEDYEIYLDGKKMKNGEPMTINFSEGLMSESFRESCVAIEKNGKNVEKSEQRQRAKELLG